MRAHSGKLFDLDLYIGSTYVNAIDGEHLALETREHETGREQLGELYHLAPERVVLRQGSVVEALRAIGEETNPGIVVIGTLARTGIKGKLIGNASEKLLDIVTADLQAVN